MFAPSFYFSPLRKGPTKISPISSSLSSSLSSSQNLYDFMAVTVGLSTLVSSSMPIVSHDSSKQAQRGSLAMMCATNPVPAGLQIRSYDHNKIKVFEDKLNGIICYKDGNGEIICEGYDEGPRLSQQISRITCNSSGDAERVDLLHRCWLHVSDEKELTLF